MYAIRRAMPPGCFARRFAACALFLWCCLCAAPPAGAAETILSRNTAFARETLALINAERQKVG